MWLIYFGDRHEYCALHDTVVLIKQGEKRKKFIFLEKFLPLHIYIKRNSQFPSKQFKAIAHSTHLYTQTLDTSWTYINTDPTLCKGS